MALSNLPLTQFDAGSITFKDGTPTTPLSCVARLDRGDLQISGMRPGMKDTAVYQRRGELVGIRGTTKVFATFTFTLYFTEFSEATSGTVLDFLFATEGTPYEDRVSTNTSMTDKDLFDIVYVLDRGPTLTLNDIEVTDVAYAEGDPTTLTISGTVYGEIDGNLLID